MISWKHSFKRLNEEYEIAKKKKQALDNLFEKGRISQATRDSFDTDINAVIMEIEKQQKELLTKMQGKAQELESQIKTLETLLANYEIQHVVGEIDEEMYQREITLLSTGLESARNELNIIKDATNQLCPPVETPATEPPLPAEEQEVEVVQSETAENFSDAPTQVEAPAEPYSQEPVVTMEEATPEAPLIENVCTTPEETPQIVEESPDVIEDQPEITEEMPQVEDSSEEIVEEQTQTTEEMTPSLDETPETGEEAEATEELSQSVEDEPQVVEETHKTAQETLEEAAQEISVEVMAEEEQSDEEAAETAEASEAEYEEL
ncbi:MAG: CdvA-like protein [Candidatus Bathyarchaeota archaeon]|nr:CdvA-like protein [Candidatus Bathyarchaeota archaeon]